MGGTILTLYLLVALSFLVYVLLDGIDLGVGIVSLLRRNPEYTRAAIRSIGPVWHANQTWLIVFGTLLFGAFPVVYSVALSSLYLPVILMLIGFIFRGIGLELYETAEDRQGPLGLAFGAGSLLATLAQGWGVGAVIWGLIPAAGSGVWVWFHPFPLFLGVGLSIYYVLLGSVWMTAKTEGPVQETVRGDAVLAARLALAGALVLVVWALVSGSPLARRGLSWPGAIVSLLPLLIGAAGFLPLLTSWPRPDVLPLTYALGLVTFLGLGVAGSLYPTIVLRKSRWPTRRRRRWP